MLQNPHVLLTFDKVHNPLRLPRESTSELPKVVRTWCVLYVLTSKCASRHNGVHFFDIATAKSGSDLVFCAFWLRNVLRATTACTFSTSQLPKVFRSWCVLHILNSKCASRHNGVQLFISHLASWLRIRCFSEPTFRPAGATTHWKNAVFRDFPTFSRAWIFFLLTLSLLWSSLFYSSLLSDSSRLCLSSAHFVGSLTSKLPSTMSNDNNNDNNNAICIYMIFSYLFFPYLALSERILAVATICRLSVTLRAYWQPLILSWELLQGWRCWDPLQRTQLRRASSTTSSSTIQASCHYNATML